MLSKDKPYVLFVAEIIYSEISKIKKNNIDFSNIDAVESFIGTKIYKEISGGKFHDEWFEELKKIILLIKIQKKRYQKKQ